MNPYGDPSCTTLVDPAGGGQPVGANRHHRAGNRIDLPGDWMTMLPPPFRSVPLLVLAVLASACARADTESPGGAPADRGAQLAQDHGCTSCHGTDGDGGVGPSWRGLAGSEIELTDGRTVVADTEYLRRAITDPGAEVRAGYAVPMPEVPLDDDEVDDLVAYVESFR